MATATVTKTMMKSQKKAATPSAKGWKALALSMRAMMRAAPKDTSIDVEKDEKEQEVKNPIGVEQDEMEQEAENSIDVETDAVVVVDLVSSSDEDPDEEARWYRLSGGYSQMMSKAKHFMRGV